MSGDLIKAQRDGDPAADPTGSAVSSTAPAASDRVRLRRMGTDTVVFWSLATGALALSIAAGNDSFERFYGSLSPVVVVTVASIAGAFSLRILSNRGWLRVGHRTAADLGLAALAGVVFTVPAIAFDNLIGFPEDLNVAWPRSVLFYPAIAFVAEVVFHVAPLASLVLVLGWQFNGLNDARRIWITIVVIAGIETAFHTASALTGQDRRLALFVAPHLAVLGAYQLVLLRRHGLAALMGFRLGYYLVWHIIWGQVRLTLLF